MPQTSTPRLTAADYFTKIHKELETIQYMIKDAVRSEDIETSLHYIRAAEGRTKVMLKAVRKLKFRISDELKLEQHFEAEAANGR